jgi:hypothetical protein
MPGMETDQLEATSWTTSNLSEVGVWKDVCVWKLISTIHFISRVHASTEYYYYISMETAIAGHVDAK